MKLLLDTHIFLWFLNGDAQLPVAARDTIRDPANEVYLSVVSVWEAVIKHALGRLPFPATPALSLPQLRAAHHIASLPVEEGALPYLAGLPALHRDPFDRIMVAQALQHGLTLVSVDAAVRVYPVPVFP